MSQANGDPVNKTPDAPRSTAHKELTLEKIFDETWTKTNSFLKDFWIAFALILLITMLLSLILMLIVTYILPPLQPILTMLLGIPLYIIKFIAVLLDFPEPSAIMFLTLLSLIPLLPLFVGLQMMCIAYVSGQPYGIKMIFDYFHKPMRYWFVYLWLFTIVLVSLKVGLFLGHYFASDVGLQQGWGIISYLIFLPLAAIICLYFSVSYWFAFPLLADKKLKTWQALEMSRQKVTQHWKTVFPAILGIIFLIQLTGAALFLLSHVVHPSLSLLNVVYIWLMPFTMLATAVMYRDLFR